MNQRYDLIAFSLLVFSVIVLTALTISPDKFAIKDWQPLMAAFVALGAASMAYRAAMAKVDFDRQIAQQAEKRKTLALCLRLVYAVKLMGHEANNRLRRLADAEAPNDRIVRASRLEISEPQALKEAWSNLESLPKNIATYTSNLLALIYDLNNYRGSDPDMRWTLTPEGEVPPPILKLRETFDSMVKQTAKAQKAIEEHLKSIGE